MLWFVLAFLGIISNNVKATQEMWSGVINEILPDQEFIDSFIRYESYHKTFNRTWFEMVVEYRPQAHREDVQQRINYLYSKFDDKELAFKLILTFTDENRQRKPYSISTRNEWGFWQLTIKNHEPFVKSKRFFDPYSQIDYLVDVYWDRQFGWRHGREDLSPRVWRSKKELYRDLFTIN